MGIALDNRVLCHAGKGQNKKTKDVEASELEAVVEGTDEGASLKVITKRRRAKAESTVPQFGIPPAPPFPTTLPSCCCDIVSYIFGTLTSHLHWSAKALCMQCISDSQS